QESHSGYQRPVELVLLNQARVSHPLGCLLVLIRIKSHWIGLPGNSDSVHRGYDALLEKQHHDFALLPPLTNRVGSDIDRDVTIRGVASQINRQIASTLFVKYKQWPGAGNRDGSQSMLCQLASARQSGQGQRQCPSAQATLHRQEHE